MNSAEKRWAAARRIVEACPSAASDLDICMSLKPGRVHGRAIDQKWKLPNVAADNEDASEDNLAATFASLIGIIRQEISEFERHQNTDGPSSDGRIRSLATLVKTLQGLEEMQKRMEKAADDRSVDSEDLLEIHRRLAEKIERIIQRREDK